MRRVFPVCAVASGMAWCCTAHADLTIGRHRYFLTPTPMTWHAAQAYAEAQGGYLVAIGSLAENQAVYSAFLTPESSQPLWIGFTDEAIEGTFRWANGEAVRFTNWRPGEPNNFGPPPGEDFAHMNADGGWVDNSGGAQFCGIVEIPPAPCPADVTSTGATGGPDEQVTVDDLVVYLLNFFSGDVAVADVAGRGTAVGRDGLVTVDDLVAYLSMFFAGCP